MSVGQPLFLSCARTHSVGLAILTILKVCDSVALGALKLSWGRHHQPVPEHFHLSPRRAPVPISCHSRPCAQPLGSALLLSACGLASPGRFLETERDGRRPGWCRMTEAPPSSPRTGPPGRTELTRVLALPLGRVHRTVSLTASSDVPWSATLVPHPRYWSAQLFPSQTCVPFVASSQDSSGLTHPPQGASPRLRSLRGLGGGGTSVTGTVHLGAMEGPLVETGGAASTACVHGVPSPGCPIVSPARGR